MNQEEWEQKLIKYMTESGWINDKNDEQTLGFSRHQGEHHWIRDYDKRNHRFVQFDGNRRVNIRVSNETE